ncbi:hypothetical protein OIDMADRAFT_32127 [Oidiodendron maius Zn]|uniref:Uncharacterized protein n=1 Tax=Oidiodendron maius (strain Zn) TaxID=913774 RepID=A0A0C3H181_OIDMZ|nr:hypothetical protein OIDMADRAFT_32127 [Oidiodendron maius Zn]
MLNEVSCSHLLEFFKIMILNQKRLKNLSTSVSTLFAAVTNMVMDTLDTSIILQHGIDKHRTRAPEDCRISEIIVIVVDSETLNHFTKDWVARSTRHQIIIDTKWRRSREPCGELQQRIERSSTTDVKIDVDASVVPKQEVFQRISIICQDKPRIILSAHCLRIRPDGRNFCRRRVISRYSGEPDVVDDARDFGNCECGKSYWIGVKIVKGYKERVEEG